MTRPRFYPVRIAKRLALAFARRLLAAARMIDD